MSETRRCMATCAVCLIQFDCSPRSARDYRAGRAEPRCMMHRRRRGDARADATERAILRRFWLDRFSVEECVQMGRAIESYLRSPGRSPAALTATARDPRR